MLFFDIPLTAVVRYIDVAHLDLFKPLISQTVYFLMNVGKNRFSKILYIITLFLWFIRKRKYAYIGLSRYNSFNCLSAQLWLKLIFDCILTIILYYMLARMISRLLITTKRQVNYTALAGLRNAWFFSARNKSNYSICRTRKLKGKFHITSNNCQISVTFGFH